MQIRVRNRQGKEGAERDKIIEYSGDEGKSLLTILRENNIYPVAPCNGNGTCGKCRVQFLTGGEPYRKQEEELLSQEELSAGVRLACLTIPKSDAQIEILAEKEQDMAVEIHYPSEKIKSHKTGEKQSFGVAIDLGTTTIAAELINLESGEIIETAATVNHQRAYGADVISRIQASVEGKAEELRELVQKDLRFCIRQLLEKQNLKGEEIADIAIAGNTTMCHLLLGYSCETLGVSPFCPVDISMQKKNGAELLNMPELNVCVTILPGISSFVGADITAGIFAGKMAQNKEYILLLDIGTNGEMAIGNQEKIWVASAAAGPAFEGGNLSCGMASIPGAICHVTIDKTPLEKGQMKENGAGTDHMTMLSNCQCRIQTIGNEAPTGICGTGVIDTVYELVKNRIVDENGTMTDEFFETGFPLAEGGPYFSQKDVREVQMAKAAIRAGIETLIKEAKISRKEIKQVYLAGGFGYQMDALKAAGIGMLPEDLADRMKPLGNTALEGTRQYLLSKDQAAMELERIRNLAEEINLALNPYFNDLFMEQMFFSV